MSSADLDRFIAARSDDERLALGLDVLEGALATATLAGLAGWEDAVYEFVVALRDGKGLNRPLGGGDLMAQAESDDYGRGQSPRPWLCPERRCSPLLNLRDGEYADITVPEPGQSWTCWGSMAEPVTFVYDGVEHTNDHNCCHYTPLKGLIRWQENPADWSSLASYYSWAHKKATARAVSVLGAPRSQEADEALETSMQAIREAERSNEH